MYARTCLADLFPLSLAPVPSKAKVVPVHGTWREIRLRNELKKEAVCAMVIKLRNKCDARREYFFVSPIQTNDRPLRCLALWQKRSFGGRVTTPKTHPCHNAEKTHCQIFRGLSHRRNWGCHNVEKSYHMGLSPKKLRKLTYFLKEGLPAYLGGGAGAGIPSLKVKPYVVKYKFQKIVMYCTHPPQCP